MIYRNDKGQVVATMTAGILQKKVNSKKHKLRIMNAYAVDEKILSQAKPTIIEVLETDTGNLYRIEIETFLIHSKTINFGHGKQLATNLKWWTLYPKGQDSLL
jgi:hypothetical protein